MEKKVRKILVKVIWKRDSIWEYGKSLRIQQEAVKNVNENNGSEIELKVNPKTKDEGLGKIIFQKLL